MRDVKCVHMMMERRLHENEAKKSKKEIERFGGEGIRIVVFLHDYGVLVLLDCSHL